MTDHPNVTTVNRMTKAIFDQDRETLSEVLAEDLTFHLRGPYAGAGDHQGAAGLLGALGGIFEATNGDIKLDQRFCLGTDGWASEWEHAVLGRNGKTLESDNSFVYRIIDGRIVEMWMMLGADPDEAALFFA